jgi:hypothetical protein
MSAPEQSPCRKAPGAVIATFDTAPAITKSSVTVVSAARRVLLLKRNERSPPESLFGVLLLLASQ